MSTQGCPKDRAEFLQNLPGPAFIDTKKKSQVKNVTFTFYAPNCRNFDYLSTYISLHQLNVYNFEGPR